MCLHMRLQNFVKKLGFLAIPLLNEHEKKTHQEARQPIAAVFKKNT